MSSRYDPPVHAAHEIRRWRSQLLLLLAFGVLHALAYPRPNLWPLAHVSLVPLTVLALRGAPRRRVLMLTLVFGVAWVLFMVSWIRPLFPLGFVLMGLYIPLAVGAPYMVLLPLIHRRARVPLVLAVPIVWVALEWMRGAVFFGGFPYFLQGQSQPTVLIQVADVVGAYGVSFLVCMSNGAICDWLLAVHQKRSTVSRQWLSLATGVAVLASNLAYGAWRMAQAPAEGGPALRIAVVQSNVSQAQKLHASEDDKAQMLTEMLRLSDAVLRQPEGDGRAGVPDLIVWPETAIPRPLDDAGIRLSGRWADYRQRIERFAARHGVCLLVGALATPWPPGNRPPSSWYNSAYLFTPRGMGGRYDKVRRLPFGEYVPWAEHHPWAWRWARSLSPHQEDRWILAGEGYNTLELPGRGSFVALICFEDVFTSIARTMAWAQGPKRVWFLVNISNDGWFAGSAQGPQHEQMARFRCVENRLPMARAVNTGISGFIDSTGRVTRRVEVSGRTQGVAGTASAMLELDTRTTVYAHIGDALPITCVVLTLILVLMGATPWLGKVCSHAMGMVPFSASSAGAWTTPRTLLRPPAGASCRR